MTKNIRSAKRYAPVVVTKLSLLIASMLVPALPRVDSAFCQSKTDTAIGKVECIQVARYKATQWATCVSDSYIRQKSKGKHGCLEEKENCLYQCMLEVHGSDSGDISTPCGCSTNATTTSETTDGPSSTKLPSWCSSPTGTECDWYGNCLNPRYRHCGERFATEIVAFAEQFCRLFLNAYSQFASLGVLWLNGVRKCFMVNLVPRLRRWQQADSCEELTTSAITSLSDCFVAPFPGIPSICGVPLADLWGMFWHLRQTLPASSRRGLEVMMRSIENCAQFQRVDLGRGRVKKVILQLGLSAATSASLKRDLKFPKSEQEKLAKTIGDELAAKFLLKENEIAWFSYTHNASYHASYQSKRISFLLANGYEYKLSQKSPNSKPLENLNHTVLKLVTAVRRNTLFLRTVDSRERYKVTGITVCGDLACLYDSWNSTVLASRSVRSSSVAVNSYLMYGYHATLFYIYNVTLK